MIAVIQRVSSGEVKIEGRSRGKIGQGLVILLGVADDDGIRDADWLVEKIVGLRVFEDSQNKMNLSLQDVGGSALVISQFTLLADYKRGRRPGFTGAARPEKAIPLYEYFMDQLWRKDIQVEKGEFGADMQVHIMNEGPVTLVLDSTVKFPR
ncbi:MAG: D-tyrosyl-tRNA(Tyr) deacylase [Candidatus Marinimicrobia bacterium]|nr:D-tyrosyl-tRNA(Tyr) deacylase [Candidatus Neomarinimicrobiota bacterium]